MPLKLKPPRPGKTPNYAIRGTYLGISVDRTSGTPDRARAAKALAKIKSDIECGSFATAGSLTFAQAALSYVRAGGEKRYLWPLSDYFGDTPVDAIDQASIDKAAHELYPDTSAATRNRQAYTPVSAILRHAGVHIMLRRPKGAQGDVRVDWLWPEQAQALFEGAGEVDAEFRLLLELLTYTGPRLSEALGIKVDDVRLGEAFAFIGHTKNGDPRPVHLPPVLVAALANHPRGLERNGERLFRFRKNGALYLMMDAARSRAQLPVHATFHTLRHTWATWMRRYAGLDTKGLMATGAWADEKSAARYQHVVITEEARRSDMLPTMQNRGKSVESGKR